MSEALKKLDAAFEVLVGIESDMEAFLQSEDAGLTMKADGKATVRDGITALRTLVSRLAGALAEKSVRSQAEEAIEKAITERIPEAAALQLPAGSVVVHGDRPEELTIVALRKASTELLTQLVKGVGKALAGGSDDVLAIVEKVSHGKTSDHWSSRVYAWEGYPEIGSVIVKAVDDKGLLTKEATGPTEPEDSLAPLGRYLVAASRKKNVRVKLVDEGDAKPVEGKD